MRSASLWTRDLYRVLMNRDPASGADELRRFRQAEDLVAKIKREAFMAGAETYRKYLIEQAAHHGTAQFAPGE